MTGLTGQKEEKKEKEKEKKEEKKGGGGEEEGEELKLLPNGTGSKAHKRSSRT